MRIKNWHKFQHFKDRKPPWIKLYRDILDDIEWFELDPVAAKALVMIWLIASEDEGNLPDLKRLSFRLRMTEQETTGILGQLSHWLEFPDIAVISTRYHGDALETETETYKPEGEAEERESKPRAKTAQGTRLASDVQLADDWLNEALKIRPEWNSAKALAVFAEFKDYWIAQAGAKGRKADWLATWRNWCRREKGFNRSAAQSTSSDRRAAVAEQIMGGNHGRNNQAIDVTPAGAVEGGGADIPALASGIRQPAHS